MLLTLVLGILGHFIMKSVINAFIKLDKMEKQERRRCQRY